jgi:hypothetical protein
MQESRNKSLVLNELTDLTRHTDHKIAGIFYVVVFATSLYLILTDMAYYESIWLLHVLTTFAGCIVSLSALRNFKFLSKKQENPGMFAKNRTFSYAFLQENLFFQVALGVTYLNAHPRTQLYISPLALYILVGLVYYIREFVPKTSYTSWEVGNSKVNSRFNGWVSFINLQVKIVRWNYLLKKELLLYMFVGTAAEQLFGVPPGTYISTNDRYIYYLLNLDAMHNITTTFFLQTLKFKGLISAELFSFLFNASPIIGAVLTVKFCMQHHFTVSFALAVLLVMTGNLAYIYPSKYSTKIKSRMQFVLTFSVISVALVYEYLTTAV